MCPTSIQNRVHKARAYHSLAIERVFLKDDIARSSDTLCSVSLNLNVCIVRLVRSFPITTTSDSVHYWPRMTANSKSNSSPSTRKTSNGCVQSGMAPLKPNMDTIINLANIELSPVQKELLCRGTEFGIPPSNNRKEIVLTQFEMFHKKLMKNFTPVSENQRAICTANLRAIAEEHAEKPPDRSTFSLSREHLKARRHLTNNNDIRITRPTRVELQLLSAHKSTIQKWRSSLRTRVSLSNSVRYLLMTHSSSREKVE